MKPSFVLRHARREARSALRKVGVYMAAITLGVGALVAIHSFRADVERSVRTESRALLGGDLRFERSQPYGERTLQIVDSIEGSGAGVARVTTLMSMVYAPRSDRSRLLQVHGVEGGYPFYASIRSDPPGLRPGATPPGTALVDPAILLQLGLEVGDSIRIGSAGFTVAGSLEGLPTDVAYQTAVGPRVLVSAEDLGRTELLTFGSLARYQVYFRFTDERASREIQRRYSRHLRTELVDSDTAGELARNVTRGLDTLSRFLSLVGLVALLLGGIGVASAVHVYIKERLDTVAVLRCIGATERDVFLTYLLQTGALGLLGSAAGVAIGLGVQRLLPSALGDVLPMEVSTVVHPGPVVAGLVAGVWIASIFALVPLLGLREASPLQALRRDFEGAGGGAVGAAGAGSAGPSGSSGSSESSRSPEPPGTPVSPGSSRASGSWWSSVSSCWSAVRRDPARSLAYAALALSVLLVSVWQAPSWEVGLGFAAGITAALALLYGCARLLMGAMRRFFPRRAGYPVRHGIANLFRPRNQTATVVLALGFGVFLVAAVGQVRASLLEGFRVDGGADRPNFVLFDIQADQEAEVAAVVGAASDAPVAITPVVPARLAAVGDRFVEEILSEPSRRRRPPRWVLSRLYRNTFRSEVAESEEIVAGRWWDEGGATGGSGAEEPEGRDPSAAAAGRPARISLAQEVAEDLDVGVGDRLTWDIQGVLVESEIASLRYIDWTRMEPNFYVVFEPGTLEDAPRTSVALARVEDAGVRAELQGTLVRRFPNVSVVDLALVQATLDRILDRAAAAIRFIAGFSVVAGLLVLTGALATSRFQRVREGALLRTLGARRGQMMGIVLSEYLSMGLVAGAAGILLGVFGGWMVVRFVFELDFRLDAAPLLRLWAGATILTALVGALAGRTVLRDPPLVVLRASGD